MDEELSHAGKGGRCPPGPMGRKLKGPTSSYLICLLPPGQAQFCLNYSWWVSSNLCWKLPTTETPHLPQAFGCNTLLLPTRILFLLFSLDLTPCFLNCVPREREQHITPFFCAVASCTREYHHASLELLSSKLSPSKSSTFPHRSCFQATNLGSTKADVTFLGAPTSPAPIGEEGTVVTLRYLSAEASQ